MQDDEVILAIDPGTTIMGYAVLKVIKGLPVLETMDVLKLGSTKNIYSRLEQIYTKVSSLIIDYRPTTFAIEAPFFGKNVQSMLKLGRAQGVAIAAAMQTQLAVTEYSPKKVKQSITGNGNADKEQIWKMLQTILKIQDQPKYYDASDALAVALCHYYQISSPVSQVAKGFDGWGDFISKNPDKIIKKIS
jgi:crossover junction endodeoxyribonuclease RuvC